MHTAEATASRRLLPPYAYSHSAFDDTQTVVGKRGKWGGIVLLGRAPVNAAHASAVEGLRGPLYGGTDPHYGGSDPHDGSGVLRFVRIWHAGAVVAQDDEINGLTLAGVGRGTIIDHVEVAYALDDGVEFFGGTVDVRHLAVLFSGDDGIDMDEGYQGRGQFVLVMTGTQGDRALELDSGADNVTLDARPRSAPKLSSMTFFGGGPLGRGRELLCVRRGAAGSFANLALTRPHPAQSRSETLRLACSSCAVRVRCAAWRALAMTVIHDGPLLRN